VESYDESETKIFLEEWAKKRGRKLDESLLSAFLPGIVLCCTNPPLLMKLFIDSDMALGQELFDDLHAEEVTVCLGPITDILL